MGHVSSWILEYAISTSKRRATLLYLLWNALNLTWLRRKSQSRMHDAEETSSNSRNPSGTYTYQFGFQIFFLSVFKLFYEKKQKVPGVRNIENHITEKIWPQICSKYELTRTIEATHLRKIRALITVSIC